MTRIHLDPVGGIAGDMFVAAMLDAFPDLRPRILADVAAVLPAGAGRAFIEAGQSGGLRALRFGLEAGASPPAIGSTFPALVARVDTARLAPGTAVEATALLTILARAEAEIHGVPIEHVHFHEIGDWDSLLDLVAAGSIAAALRAARWTVSALPRGNGVVRTAHGLLPVPAPAAARILEGFAWRDDGVDGERVTPTGAAILKHLVGEALPGPAGRLKTSGTGAGTRTLPGMPNVLRALVFDEAHPPTGDRVKVVAFEIDDMTGEEIGVAADRLRAEPGVLDVSVAERWGKKGRPMQSFQLVIRPEAAEAVVGRCFAETSTIGLRLREDERIVLPRDAVTVGAIGVKSVHRPGVGATRKAESDDLPGESLAARRAAKRAAEGEGR